MVPTNPTNGARIRAPHGAGLTEAVPTTLPQRATGYVGAAVREGAPAHAAAAIILTVRAAIAETTGGAGASLRGSRSRAPIGGGVIRSPVHPRAPPAAPGPTAGPAPAGRPITKGPRGGR